MTAAPSRIASSRRRGRTTDWYRGGRSAAITFVLIAAACSTGESSRVRSADGSQSSSASAIPPGWPEGAPYITGIVTQFSNDTVRIEERPAMKGGSPKAVLTVDDATMLRGIAGAEKPRLRVGQRVSAWIGPRVMESYPIRAKALAIQIVEDTTTSKKR
jgi:hypothetical protein